MKRGWKLRCLVTPLPREAALELARVQFEAVEQLQRAVLDLQAELGRRDEREVALVGELRASLDREAERAFAAQLIKLQEAESQEVISSTPWVVPFIVEQVEDLSIH